MFLFCVINKKLKLHVWVYYHNGGSSGNRTSDTRIFSPLLYRLSYEAKKIMAVPTGVEPAIFCVTGRRDNHYTTEPMVAGDGFEPTTSGLWAQRATELLHPAINLDGGGKGIRTPAPLARPPGFQDRSLQPDLGIPPLMVPKVGLEPTRGLNLAGF